jgi:acetylornithine deacetylase/succinyl-diaminopimelate desuccinylase-like protein
MLRTLVTLVVCSALTVPHAFAQQVDFAALGDEAVERVQENLRVNTINPPGNEQRAVEFFAAIFEAEGIRYETAESAPGRGNIWAILEGGDKPALILLHHTDVVPADEDYWDVPPLSGVVQDEHIYGRGALDTKTLGIFHLQTFLALHRASVPLNRDVIFMATADEEAGGFFGAGWLVENRPDLFENVGWLLNEGGGGSIVGNFMQFGIEVTQKVPIWLGITATGTPGHGSTPGVMSSVNRLIRALYNIQNHNFEPRIVPAVDIYFKELAERAPEPWGRRYANMAETVRDPDKLLELQIENRGLHALTRNTCSITMLEGSNKVNVVPPEVSAQIDCRMLPDQNPDSFVAELQSVINDPAVDIEVLMAFAPAVSTTDTELYEAMSTVAQHHFPGVSVIPSVSTGFTDSHFFREIGINSYGFNPAMIPVADSPGVHGNNERVSVENVRRGTQMMYEIVESVVRGIVP